MKKIIVLLISISICSWANAGLKEADKAYETKNYDVVFNELKPLAEQGNAEAQYKLGVLFDAGQGVKRDLKQAIFWYQRAATQGYAQSQYNLGGIYARGNGVAQDYIQALSWYRKSAAQGYASAYVGLGYMYNTGQGVPQNDKQAVAWYRRAAEHGNIDGQFNLGMMYANGRGVSQNFKQSLFWYKKAAIQGDLEAIHNIGVQYKLGQGVKLNILTGYTLFELVSILAPSYQLANSNRIATAQLLSEEQIEEGKALAQEMTTNFPSSLNKYFQTH